MTALPAFEETISPGQAGDVLELDELWSFVEKKTQECWLWIALCRRTRQIVAYTVGDRSQESAVTLREHVPEDDRRRATRSDFWLTYGAAFPNVPTASAARRKARPTTPNASSAPCAHV